VYPTLRAGNTLTIAIHLDIPPKELEHSVLFREDGQFEEEGVQRPIPDLLPLTLTLYERMLLQVVPGDVFTVTFRVQRL